MSNFVKNSIFTDYAFKRINTALISSSSYNITTGLVYKIGSNVTINKLNPSSSDFSGLEYTLNASNDSNIIITKSGSVYTIRIAIDNNFGHVLFNNIGIFDTNGTLVAFFELDNFIQVSDLIYNNIYLMYITIDIDSGEVVSYKKEVQTTTVLSTTNLLYSYISVKLGDGSNDLDTSKTDVSKLIYSLPVDSVTKNGSVITVSATIPEELQGISITEIGLFENFFGGNNMFSYTKVSTIKPADLGFKLIIKVNLELETVQFYPELPEIVINTYTYAYKQELIDLTRVFVDLTTNLERIIRNNATEIGYNLAQVYYEKEKGIRDCLASASYSSKYNRLLEEFDSNVKDLYFLTRHDYSSYKVKNLAKDDSYITVSGDKFISTNDSITFNEGAVTLLMTALIGNTSQSGVIITKEDNASSIYFSLSLEHQSNSKLLRFQLMTTPNIIGFTYDLNTSIYKNYMLSNYLVYAICFNGSFTNPQFKFYINSEEQTITAIGSGTVTLTDYSNFALKNYYGYASTATTLEDVTVTRISNYSKYMTDTEVYFASLNTEMAN